MEKSVEVLEQMFDKAEAEMKYLTMCCERQLDIKEGDKDRPNPLHIMKDIENVKAQHSHLKQEIVGIQNAQKEAVDFLRAQLSTMSEMVQKLEDQTGQQDPETVQSSLKMVEELSQLLQVPSDSIMKPPSSTTCVSSGGASRGDGVLEAGAGAASSSSSHDAGVVETKQELPNVEGAQGGAIFELSPAERRQGDSEFIPVSDEEFASVSELIRGRAKLEEVNKTYNLLWDHFKVNKNTQELNLKEMSTMGLKVTGATGQAKLKILRALKLLKISKAGSVVLL